MIVLASRRFPGARAAIDPDRGAAVRSWVAAPPGGVPAERLHLEPWADDPAPPDLPGGIPLLFPFAGRVAAPPGLVPGTWRWNGAAFAGMPCHGFAWRRPWEVVSARGATAVLRLASDDATLALYPFPFVLRLTVKLAGPDGLSLSLRIRNEGRSPMPCSAGFHPYFRLPAPGCRPGIGFPGAHAIFPYDATCTRIPGRPLPPGSPPPASPHVYLADGSSASLDLPGARVLLSFVHAPARPHPACWQPYSRPGAPFFCLEPWTAPAGIVNHPGPHGPDVIPPRAAIAKEFTLRLAGNLDF